jgi:hypothetical protein
MTDNKELNLHHQDTNYTNESSLKHPWYHNLK